MKINNILRSVLAATLMVFAASAVVSCSGGVEVPSPQKPKTPQNPPETNPGTDGDGLFIAVSGGRGAETRAHLHDDVLGVGGYYHWDATDRIGLVIADGDTGTTLVDNLPMTAREGHVTHTAFTGELTRIKIDELEGCETFDYYSYFPYNDAIDLEAIPFTIPSSHTLTPGRLDLIAGVPMVAEPVKGGRSAVVLASQRGEVSDHELSAHFTYKHLVSYAAIGLDLSLLPAGQTVSRIDIAGSSPISGDFTYNMYDGTVAPGSDTGISVTIAGGLATGPDNVIYLPMAPGTVGSLTFTFHIDGGTQPLKKTVPGATFVKGMIHRLNVVPPAEFTASTTFTAPASGYYYIEAWGGNGGNGGDGQENGAAGGTSLKQAGMFYIAEGITLYVQVGTAGGNGGGTPSGRDGSAGGVGGGVTGTWFGRGGVGGIGGRGGATARGGSGGGGGGAASGVLVGGTDVGNIIIASSGGGGGGGGAGNSQTPGKGGNSDLPGGNSSNLGGSAGGQGVRTDSTWGENGDNGDNSTGINFATRGGGGGGAGGGGFNGVSGGGGRMGNGGVPSGAFGYAGAGGAGGARYKSTETPNTPGYQIFNYDRPATIANGYVVITFFRQ